MNLHEYQAKEIFRRYGLPVPPGKVVRSADEAAEACHALGGEKFVVKAQIHAGGRGKAGGVKLVDGKEAVRAGARELIGRSLRTHQTGPSGQPVNVVLIESRSEIVKEYYTAIVLDRSQEKPCLLFSGMGGVDIEEVAQKRPEAIHKRTFSASTGLSREVARSILEESTTEMCSSHTSLSASDKEKLTDILVGLAKVFLETDASLVEVNPLGYMRAGNWQIVDAKVRLDDNGLERHPELAALRDPGQEDPREVEAKKFDLSYVGLEGNIGCMVNGAGLAMATMDLIKLAGGEPANFLDVGGGASKEKVTAAFKIILTDPKVRAILVNIFGGIMRCDVIAEGILAAVKEIQLKVPLVVRLEGTKVNEGKEILKKSAIDIISAASLEEAAEKAVSCVRSR